MSTRRRIAPLLALETATGGADVALVDGDRVLAAISLSPERALSEQLLPAIDAMLTLAGVGLDDLAGFAISIGPGSFTGLRVGLATLKGLAFGSTLRAAPVSTLAAVAQAMRPFDGPVAALLDARRDEVYAAVYRGPDPFEAALVPEGLYAIDDLVARIPPGALLAGDAAMLCSARASLMGRELRPAPPDLSRAHAASVGRIGAAMLAAGQGVDPATLVPRYLRRAEAEARRLGSPLEA